MLGCCGPVAGVGPAREDPAVNHRVQRLDPSVHQFRKSGDSRDRDDGQSRLDQLAGRSAGRHEFEAAVVEASAEADQTGFVRNAEQGAGHELWAIPEGKWALSGSQRLDTLRPHT
jgi:hypothetical protein